MKRSLLLASIVTVGLLTPTLADAQYYGYATRNVNVRAGPDRSYPLVGWLQEGTEIEIFGCLDTWRWCDIQGGVYRGWAYSGFLAYPYEGGWATILEIGPESGLPLLSFTLDVYWDSYYTTWPWYDQWPWWSSRPPIYHRPWRPPPRPPHVHPRPPIGVLPPRPPVGQSPIAKPPGGKPPSAVPPSVSRPPSAVPPSVSRPPSAVPPTARPPATRPPSAIPPSVPPPSINPAGPTPWPGPPPSINPAGPTPRPLAPPSQSGPPAAAPAPAPAPRPHPRAAPG
jgi:uncharacterized protein YraI